MKGNTILYIVVAVVLLVLGAMFLTFDLPVVSVSAEKLPGWELGPLKITNALLTSWVSILIIIVVAFLGTRNMQLVPSGLQNVLELIVESLYNLTESVSGAKWAPKFFAIPATIFIYVLVSNWFGLLPGLAGIGLCDVHHGDETHVEETHVEETHGEETHVEETHAEETHVEDAAHTSTNTCAEGEVIVPFFRSPSADLNNTLMLGLFTQIAAQVFGFMALGTAGYLGKFFVFTGFKKPGIGGKLMGLIDMFVGLLEFLSEFVKVIAFTFRLFGNIFAGEVMLIVLTFLVPLVLTLPFLGLEVFVGLIQAFVFFILSVAFYTLAVTSHDHEEAH